MKIRRGLFSLLVSLNLLVAAAAPAVTGPIQLDVDATDAPRNLLHARLHIPAAPGPLTLFYPKWIPGEHMPSGPINDLAGLKISANGKPLDWRRDPDNMYAFHLDVPAGAEAVEVSLDFLLPTGRRVVFHRRFLDGQAAGFELERGAALSADRGAVETAIRRPVCSLPEGWKSGTALPVAGASGAHIEFSPVPLETLVDSPVIAGEYFRTIELTPGEQPPHFIHLVADSAAALEMTPEDIRHFMHLVKEENALFGAHHYRDYHFLLTLSDRVSHFGLEHHESSDNRVGENYLTDRRPGSVSRSVAARNGPFVERQIPPSGGHGHAGLSAADAG